jgi:hypothetical protein
MANLWCNLAKVLGIGSVNTVVTKGDPDKKLGFLTTTPATTFDNNTGNAHPYGNPTPDRWFFNYHVVGEAFGLSPRYYDPTVNIRFSDITKLIECSAIADPCYGQVRRIDCERGIYLLELLGSGIFTYYGISESSSVTNKDISTMDFPDSNTYFTGSYSISPFDTTGDGRFDGIEVTADVNVAQNTSITIFGSVWAGQSLITNRSNMKSMERAVFTKQCQPGITNSKLVFSGYDISDSELDGPYTINLYLYDANAVSNDSLVLDTPAYTASQFGETTADIMDMNDFAVDIEGDFLFDSLRVEISLNVYQSGNHYINSTLLTPDGMIISSVDTNSVLPTGIQAVTLDFDGREINLLDDPNTLTLEITLHNSNGEQQDHGTFTTSVYNPLDFESKDLIISGPSGDIGYDADGDGLFDFLRVEIGVEVTDANDYEISAWLQDHNGIDITFAQTDLALGTGQQTIILDFEGYKIHDHGKDGPYRLAYILIKKDDNIIDSSREVYLTSSYQYEDFKSYLPVDFNRDSRVDKCDLSMLISFWLDYEPSIDIAPLPDGDGIVNFADYAIFAGQWEGIDINNISSHVFEIEILNAWNYGHPNNPNDTNYEFELDLLTDGVIEKIDFMTPGGNVFEIPPIAYQLTNIPGGYILTEWGYDYMTASFGWKYYSLLQEPNDLTEYGDGEYTIVVNYENGYQDHTTVWFGIPDTNNPMPQPQEPEPTFPVPDTNVTSPVTFTWKPCIGSDATIIWIGVENEDTEEEIESNEPLPKEATSWGPINLSEGIWEAYLSFESWYETQNIDGIDIRMSKYSEIDYEFTVVP